jgi:hypothetical protein
MNDENPNPAHAEGDPTPSAPVSGPIGRRRAIAIGVIAAVVLVAGIAWAATRSNGSGSSGSASAANGQPNGSSTAAAGKGGSSSTSAADSNGASSTKPPGGTKGTGKGTQSGGSDPSGPGGSITPTTARGPQTRGSSVPVTIRTETVPPDIKSAYVAAFQAECNKIWSIADADGLLWDPDALENGGSRVSDCLSELVPNYAGVYDNVSDARQGGIEDADGSADDLTIGGRLQNTRATRFWTAP